MITTPMEICSTTHHTFLVGPWEGAGEGAVHVVELDNEDHVVLILKPCDVGPFIAALVAAQSGHPIPIDVSEHHKPTANSAHG